MIRTLQIAALLTLVTTIVRADLSISPNVGLATGGGTVHISAQGTPVEFTGTQPVVWFGEVAAPNVTVVNSKTLRVITPPHAEGVVAVQVEIGSVRLESSRFGFYRERDPLLIPVAVEFVGAFGTQWTTDILVYNAASTPVNLQPEVCSFIGSVFPCGSQMIVPPQASIRIPPRTFPADGSYFELYVFPPNDQRSQLHFSVRARDRSKTSDPGTEIPTTSEFRDGKIVLLNVPVSDGQRANLRVYDQVFGLSSTMTVRVYDSATEELLTTRQRERRFPTDSTARGSVSFADLLVDPLVRMRANVRIEIDEDRASLWALLTLTDNVTQRITVITSQ